MMDSKRRILIDLKLHADKFSIFKFKNNDNMHIGLNLNHFYKMLKTIKKKDSILLFIEEDKPRDLGIKVLPRENTRITISYIKIQNVQNLDIELPTGYKHSIIVQSNEYQKMCKDMTNIASIVQIFAQKFHIRFLCNAGSVYSREVLFGEIDDNESEDEENITEYNDNFEIEQLLRIIKISGLNNTMQIFPCNKLPLLFKSNIGNLGEISIYVKSKQQIEEYDLTNK